VKHSADQASGGAGDTETPEHAPVHVLANHGKTKGRSDEMWNGDERDCQLRSNPCGKQRREYAADAKAGDGSDGACDDTGEREEHCVVHDSSRDDVNSVHCST
jgi:hypothetical protein